MKTLWTKKLETISTIRVGYMCVSSHSIGNRFCFSEILMAEIKRFSERLTQENAKTKEGQPLWQVRPQNGPNNNNNNTDFTKASTKCQISLFMFFLDKVHKQLGTGTIKRQKFRRYAGFPISSFAYKTIYRVGYICVFIKSIGDCFLFWNYIESNKKFLRRFIIGKR